MKNSSNIPPHYYDQANDNIYSDHEKPFRSVDPQLPFIVTRFESANTLAQADYPHRHDCYELLYISEGEGTHIIDFVHYNIEPPMFFFLSKDQVHFWQLTKSLKGYVLLFPEESLLFPASDIIKAHDLSFFHHVGHAPYLSVDLQHLTMINGMFEGIEQEYHSEGMRSPSVLRAYLHILLTQLQRSYLMAHPDNLHGVTSSLVGQFEQLVSEHFIEEQSVLYYAKKIGVSASHLRDTVKAVTGYAAGQIIRQKLVLEAKRLLVHSNSTVAEIGYSLGFEDASYFGRFFKRETGTSPVAFRESAREKYHLLQVR